MLSELDSIALDLRFIGGFSRKEIALRRSEKTFREGNFGKIIMQYFGNNSCVIHKVDVA